MGKRLRLPTHANLMQAWLIEVPHRAQLLYLTAGNAADDWCSIHWLLRVNRKGTEDQECQNIKKKSLSFMGNHSFTRLRCNHSIRKNKTSPVTNVINSMSITLTYETSCNKKAGADAPVSVLWC